MIYYIFKQLDEAYHTKCWGMLLITPACSQRESAGRRPAGRERTARHRSDGRLGG